jgi:hypothetical protein
MSRARTSRLAGGTGVVLALFAAPGAWILLQQGEGALVYLACPRSGPPIGILIGVAAFCVCLAAGGLAWRLVRTLEAPAQRFLAQVGAGAAAIFALAALIMTAAIWLVPSCAR